MKVLGFDEHLVVASICSNHYPTHNVDGGICFARICRYTISAEWIFISHTTASSTLFSAFIYGASIHVFAL